MTSDGSSEVEGQCQRFDSAHRERRTSPVHARTVLFVCALAVVGSACKRHHGPNAPDASTASASIELLPPPTPLIIPDAGAVLPLLDVVALAKAKTFTSLAEARRTPESVYKLDLSGQDLPSVPGLQRLTRLQVLNLSHNQLHDVTQVTALRHLQQLDLSYNPLKKLPVDVGNLTELSTLDVSHVPDLAAVPFELGQLGKLKVLRLSGSIHRLPEELTDISSLSVLSLRGCMQLTALPQELGKLRALSELDLVNTGLPASEYERAKSLLPSANVLGAAGSFEEESKEAEAAATEARAARQNADADAAVDLPCGEILEKGREAYLQPLVEDSDASRGGAEEDGPLERVASHYVACRELRDEFLRQSLTPKQQARLTTVQEALEAFENARDALVELTDGDDVAAAVRKQQARTERADVMSDVVRLTHEGSAAAANNEHSPAPNATLFAVQKQLVALDTPPDPEQSQDYGRAVAELKEATQRLTAAVRPLPERAQGLVFRRMESILKE